MRFFLNLLCIVFLFTNLIACGGSGGNGTLSFKATSIELDEDVDGVTFSIARISLSETGEDWSLVVEDIQDITIDSDSMLDMEEKELPSGEYHGVKVELSPGITYELADGSTVQKDFPDILLYKVPSGMYRYSTSENGYQDTNEFWMFTTRNEAISSPVEVESNETSFLVFSFRPRFQLNAEDDVGLAASCSYTSFLY
jgi:hypothetical protein